MTEQMKLYQAVKWEAHEYKATHGMTMTELWKLATGKGCNIIDMMFWKRTCLEDYKFDHEGQEGGK